MGSTSKARLNILFVPLAVAAHLVVSDLWNRSSEAAIVIPYSQFQELLQQGR
ncbi:MAG TPA: hypothetical protein VMK42_04880 [Anaeromyxobacteraceae bacterium]|nr:hypothetical protein [Anaeromyxobacteraceae bacterium]